MMSSTVCAAQRYCWPRLAKLPVNGSTSPIRTSGTLAAGAVRDASTATERRHMAPVRIKTTRRIDPPGDQGGRILSRRHDDDRQDGLRPTRVEVGRVVERLGAPYLGVAYLEEGLRLRQHAEEYATPFVTLTSRRRP